MCICKQWTPCSFGLCIPLQYRLSQDAGRFAAVAAIYSHRGALRPVSLEYIKAGDSVSLLENVDRRGTMKLRLSVFCVWITTYTCILCFNMDTKHVITRTSGVANSVADGSSYFGYSVALHRDYLNKPRVIVGAPRRTWNGVKHRGAVYLCPLGPAEGEECWPAYIPRDSEDSGFSHTTEWMGGSVVSGPTGRFVACAHRHVQTSMTEDGQRWDTIGRCVVFSRHFSIEGVYKPCEYNQQETKEKMFYYGDCQAGTSVALGNNDQTLIMGAPGVGVWSGAVFSQQLSFSNAGKLSETRLDGQENYTQSFNLQGYSLSVGRFLPGSNNSLVQFAVGVPLWTALGQFGRVNVFAQDVERGTIQLLKSLTVYGRYSGSFFGHTVLAADITGDGLDELLVGAPMFSDHQTEIGRVWIFKNLKGRFGTENVELTGSVPFGRFGHAIVLLGDINKDGFNDVAISAPFGREDRSLGTIYIHLGSQGGLAREASQVIVASDVSHRQPTPIAFGAAMAGAFDADENGYPDLAIGSYLSEEVILLRTRPVVTIKATVTLTPSLITSKTLRICHGASGEVHTCISARICFDFSADTPLVLSKINYRLSVDRRKKDLGLKSRGFFNSTGHRRLVGRVRLPQLKVSGQVCQLTTIFLHQEFRDRTTPLEVLLKYSLPNDQRKRSSNVTLLQPLPPVINHTLPSQRKNLAKAFVHFAKQCGLDSLCIPDLQLTGVFASDLDPGAVYILGRHTTVTFKVMITNRGENAYESKLLVTAPRILSVTRVSSSSVNTFCFIDQTYNETLVECDLGDPLAAATSHTLDIVMSTLHVPLSVTSLDIKFSVRSSNLEVNSTLRDNTAILRLNVGAEADFALEGNSSPDQYRLQHNHSHSPSVETEIGGHLNYTLFASNHGPSAVPEASLLLALPTHTSGGKSLLYVMDIVEDGNVYCDDEHIVNPRGIKTLSQINFEHRLQKYEPDSRPARGSSFQSLITVKSSDQFLNNKTQRNDAGIAIALKGQCETDFIRCTLLTCHLTDMYGGSEAGVTITTRLWESTLASEELSRLKLSVIAHVRPVNSPSLIGTASDHMVISTSVFHGATDLQSKSLPPWAYGIVAVCSLLIIAAAVAIMWKVGFFKRTTKEKLKEERRKSQMYLDEFAMTELDTQDTRNGSVEEES